MRKPKKAYKLFRVRRDGSLGSLFINRSNRIELGKWLKAETHQTKGYALRPGWHTCLKPNAPHLSEHNRQWYQVEIKDYKEQQRPVSQGGLWYTAELMRVIKPVRTKK
jgi:hypothetical protein